MSQLDLHKILVPTDFSPAARVATRSAVEMAKLFGASIDLLHVTTMVPVLPPPVDLVAFETMLPELMRRVQTGLDDEVKRVREAGVVCEGKLVDGTPHSEIVRYARENSIDMIVMATHGHGGLAHAILGSATERVLHRAHCPILVIPVRSPDNA
jgi:nucleotide-binding universal stress UspA family protein